jgi:hypothetical protein
MILDNISYNLINSTNYQFIFILDKINDNIKSNVINWFLSIYNDIHDYEFNILVDNKFYQHTIDNGQITILLHLRNNNDKLNILYIQELININIDNMPYEVSNLKIEGINNNFIKYKWWNLLEKNKGYLYNKMYIKKINNNEWKEIIEGSNLFGWIDYPPLSSI